jgi:hydroxypyruvate reductase
MRETLREMFVQALRELDLPARMKERMWAKGTVLEISGDLYPFDQLRDVRVIAFGKAAAQMAATIDEILGAGRARGLVVPSAPPRQPLPNFQYIVGGHPYPNAHTIEAGEAALRMAAGATPDTMFLFLISGGGSALLDKPLFDDISIDDLAAFNRVLVTCGADIYEMNALRKHFSAVKGGRLALAAQPGRQATIYVSDVPADKPSTVASGPTMPDESSVAECRAIAARYGMIERLPAAYAARLGSGDLPETPKPGDPRFAGSRYYAVLSNQDGIDALKRLSERRGWQTVIDVSCDDWPLPRAADYLLEKLRGLRRQAGATVCLISGGELSCPVTGSGVGGRNAAFALYCAAKIAGQPLAVMSAGTDGIDGNSLAAGAVAAGDTVARACVLGLDPAESFRQSDSYTFFAELGDEIVTGPTGNNVRDLRMLVAE